jgi:hypothetical protein
MTDFCEHGYESSGSIKGMEFLHQMDDRRLFKNDSVPLTELLGRKYAYFLLLELI